MNSFTDLFKLIPGLFKFVALFKIMFALVAGTISLVGLLTCINPKLTGSFSIQQGANKEKITITPTNFLVSRIMGFVAFLLGIFMIIAIFTLFPF